MSNTDNDKLTKLIVKALKMMMKYMIKGYKEPRPSEDDDISKLDREIKKGLGVIQDTNGNYFLEDE